MRFLHIADPDQLLESAFSRARKKSGLLKKGRNKLANEKTKQRLEVMLVGEELGKRLHSAVKSVPSLDKLPKFEKNLFEAVVDSGELKKALGQMSAISVLVQKKAKGYDRQISRAETKADAKRLKKEFYGRTGSMVKSLRQSIKFYNKCSQKIKEIPKIKKNCVNVILAGFPNTGKTTILERLTGSRAKIASYQFTTKTINLGYFTKNLIKYQVIDTPGLLDRPMNKMNNVEKKAVSALANLRGIIVFVVDPTKNSGYSTSKQAKLFEEIKKNFEGEKIVVLNKMDIASKEEKNEASGKFGPETIIDGEGISSTLKQRIHQLSTPK